MESKEQSGDMRERILAATERNRRLLENAGLPREVKEIAGREFVFHYVFNGRKEATVEGARISSVTITTVKNGLNGGVCIHLTPTPSTYDNLPVLHFQLFTDEKCICQQAGEPLKCGIFLNGMGKSVHTEFEGYLLLL